VVTEQHSHGRITIYRKGYNSGMKSVLCCFLLFAAGLSAQSPAKLDADLIALANPLANPSASRNAAAQQIADDILALTEKDAPPSRQTVVDFADALARAIPRQALTEEKTKPVTQALLNVLQSAGLTSSRFHSAIDRFRDSLIALNATAAQAKRAADRLLILGQEVRGPEDIKLLNINRSK
jgi:hypothetical protein